MIPKITALSPPCDSGRCKYVGRTYSLRIDGELKRRARFAGLPVKI